MNNKSTCTITIPTVFPTGLSVSVSHPFVHPIVRGNAGKPVEFGAKLDISVVGGWALLKFCSFDAYNEAGIIKQCHSVSACGRGTIPAVF